MQGSFIARESKIYSPIDLIHGSEIPRTKESISLATRTYRACVFGIQNLMKDKINLEFTESNIYLNFLLIFGIFNEISLWFNYNAY